MTATPRFGVNYTPRRRWFHAWLDFDAAETRRDLEAIAALGLDHVRVFCLWPIFQPHRGLVSEQAVGNLLKLVDAAAACGLGVTVDALQGHLSSFDFYPAWTRTHHHRNVFTDAAVIDAQASYLHTLADALRERPNVLGLQLGNEMNNLLANDPATPTQIASWTDRLVRVVETALPGRLATHSAYDAVWYDDTHPFTPQLMATTGSVTVVHPWVFSGGCAQRYGARSPQCTHLAEYVVELARAYATDPNRPVWVQEIGAPAPDVPTDQAPEFARQTLENLASCAGLWGITWWCSHDVDRRLRDFPDLEYTLGLFDAEGTVKPLGKQLSASISELRTSPPAPVRTPALVLDAGPDRRRRCAPGGQFFTSWMRLAAAGGRPAIVLAERADPTHGVELLRPEAVR